MLGSLSKICVRLHFVVLNGNCQTLDHIANVSTSFCNNFDFSRLVLLNVLFFNQVVRSNLFTILTL